MSKVHILPSFVPRATVPQHVFCIHSCISVLISFTPSLVPEILKKVIRDHGLSFIFYNIYSARTPSQ